MKRFKILLVICICVLLTACNTANEKPLTGEYQNYIQTYEETVANNSEYTLSSAPIDSIISVCQGSQIIVKAKYLGYTDFSEIKNAHLFSVEEEFTNLINDDVIYVYEAKDTSFISGKIYYLFLNGFISSFYPHPVYSRYASSFLVGEDESGYTFYKNYSLGLDCVDDIGNYIRGEIIEKGLYNKDTDNLEPESLELACEKAEVILVVRIMTVEASSSSNPYIRYSRYCVDEVLKGEEVYNNYQADATEGLPSEIVSAAGLDTSYYPLMQSPQDTTIGEHFILLLKIDPESKLLDMYSFQNSCFRVDSDEGQLIRGYLNVQ